MACYLNLSARILRTILDNKLEIKDVAKIKHIKLDRTSHGSPKRCGSK